MRKGFFCRPQQFISHDSQALTSHRRVVCEDPPSIGAIFCKEIYFCTWRNENDEVMYFCGTACTSGRQSTAHMVRPSRRTATRTSGRQPGATFVIRALNTRADQSVPVEGGPVSVSLSHPEEHRGPHDVIIASQRKQMLLQAPSGLKLRTETGGEAVRARGRTSGQTHNVSK